MEKYEARIEKFLNSNSKTVRLISKKLI